MNFNDVVKLIMKETEKGYNESAQILDEAIKPMVDANILERTNMTNPLKIDSLLYEIAKGLASEGYDQETIGEFMERAQGTLKLNRAYLKV